MDSNSGPSAYQHNALPLGQTGSQHSMAKPTHSPQLCHTLYALIIQNIFACRTCLDGAAVLGTRFPMYQSLLLLHSCFTATETIQTIRDTVARTPTSSFTATETIQTIRDTVARTPTSSFTHLLSSACGRVRVQCCFTFTEAVRIVRNRCPRTTTCSLTQLPCSDTCCVLKLSASIRPQRLYRLLWTGCPVRPPRHSQLLSSADPTPSP